MNRELVHFSRHPVERIEARGQGADPRSKPEGFWFSVGPSWAEWCKDNDYGLDRFRFITRVELIDGANVLRLSGSWDIDRFHDEYTVDGTENDWLRNYIRWDLVAENYDGIIIAPYCWERRLEGRAHRWYYGWDCASGCIWSPRCVASLDCVELPDLSAVLEGAA